MEETTPCNETLEPTVGRIAQLKNGGAKFLIMDMSMQEGRVLVGNRWYPLAVFRKMYNVLEKEHTCQS